MKRSLLYMVLGFAVSFLINYVALGKENWQIEAYNALAFGLGWGMAHFLDRPDWALPKKLSFSLIGIFILVIGGLVFFNFETAIPSIIKFSTVFVAYYLIASFKESKSLRY